ncbi:MAG TPA: acetyl-CoA carboxylase, biotin carboxyl carrier protein, partial [Allosphingosinicella sp.]
MTEDDGASGAENGGSEGGMRVDADLVRQLAELLTENDLSEIEVEDGDRRIAVKRQLTIAQPPPPIAAPAPTPAPPSVAPPPTLTKAEQNQADDVAAAAHPGAVKSPMVG